MSSLPSRVSIVEVGPRDGLQNEAQLVSTAVKIEFIERLAAAGVSIIEATSFVRPDRVPQLADAEEVLAAVQRTRAARFSVLVPNLRGLDRAVVAGAEEIAVFAAASESFSMRNLGCSVEESMLMFRAVIERAKAEGLHVRGYVSAAFGCPYEGSVPISQVTRTAEWLDAFGCDELCLADTVGVAHPRLVREVVERVSKSVDIERIGVHMHDTYGLGLLNTVAALELGVTVVDASAGGLGGCPFAQGAKGNLATEDLVYLLHESGVETGIDLDALVDTTARLHEALGRPPASRAASALMARGGVS